MEIRKRLLQRLFQEGVFRQMTKSNEDILADRKAIEHIMADYKMSEAQALFWALLGELYYTLCQRHPELKHEYIQTMKDSFEMITRGVTK
jgi:hypothetical protein